MSLPPSGWLPGNVSTEITTPVIPLPTPFVGSYVEGGSSIETLVARPFLEFLLIEIGGLATTAAGYSEDLERTLVITLIRNEVFGTMLLDMFTPPKLSSMFYDFDAYTQLACVNGLTASVPLFGGAQSGADTAYADEVGTPTEYADEP